MLCLDLLPFVLFLLVKPILKQKVVGLHFGVLKPSLHLHVLCLLMYH